MASSNHSVIPISGITKPPILFRRTVRCTKSPKYFTILLQNKFLRKSWSLGRLVSPCPPPREPARKHCSVLLGFCSALSSLLTTGVRRLQRYPRCNNGCEFGVLYSVILTAYNWRELFFDKRIFQHRRVHFKLL